MEEPRPCGYAAEPMTSATLLALLMSVTSAAPADPLPAACGLVERLPDKANPIMKAREFGPLLGRVVGAKTPTAHGKLHAQMARKVAAIAKKARRVFHPGPDKKVNKGKARRFLERYVHGKRAPMRVGEVLFEPRPPIRAALVYTACRAGDLDATLRWARNDGGADTRATAFAAWLLVRLGRVEEARELAPRLPDEGVLGPLVKAELAADEGEAQKHHAIAARRATTEAQRLAVQDQKRRLGLR